MKAQAMDECTAAWPVFMKEVDTEVEGASLQRQAEAPASLIGRADVDLVIITSSADVNVLQTEEVACVIEACKRAAASVDIRFVSLGCLGFYASLLRFATHPARKALVLVLELPEYMVQFGLDQSGMGKSGDGFVAQAGSTAVLLSKDPFPDALRIDACDVLAKEGGGGIGALRGFITRIANALQEIPNPDACSWVSFVTHSENSHKIMKFLQMQGDAAFRGRKWLPSIEIDERHFMSRMPLLELKLYRQNLQGHSLAITSLGAGGRFGILQVSQSTAPLRICRASVVRSINRGEIWLEQFPEFSLNERRATEHGLNSFDPFWFEPKILAIEDSFLGIDNVYFEWSMKAGVAPSRT